MKKYQVTVDGQVYEVTVEGVTGTALGTVPPTPQAVTPQPPPKPAPTPAPTPAQPPVSGSGGHTVQAPMPGKILTLNVTPGTSVKSGDVLLILEAMKMENDIMAPVNGTVTSVNVHVGDSVNTGDVLVVID